MDVLSSSSMPSSSGKDEPAPSALDQRIIAWLWDSDHRHVHAFSIALDFFFGFVGGNAAVPALRSA
jgi:hypothetical protein